MQTGKRHHSTQVLQVCTHRQLNETLDFCE